MLKNIIGIIISYIFVFAVIISAKLVEKKGKEASRKYFGKEPKKMTDYEAIMLAGIPNAPSVYSLTKNPELAKQRQKQVINKMIEYKYLTQSEADKILEQ